MNGLSLRISSGSKKPNNTMNLPPVLLTNFKGAGNELIETFLKAATADEQLALLKKLLSEKLDHSEYNTINFLVSVFFHSEAKHPIKCFLSRYITKSRHLHELFVHLLAEEISNHLKSPIQSGFEFEYPSYKEVVPKIAMCIENFPPGLQAVRSVEKQLALYLCRCLYTCREGLTYSRQYRSPSEKNVIYSVVHSTLRLLLHIITKNQAESVENSMSHACEHANLVKTMKRNVLPTILKLLRDNDVPMDTKSVCGIVLLSLDAYSFSPPLLPIWKDFLYENRSEVNKQVQLAMYSAVVTTVPMSLLQEPLPWGDESAPAVAHIIQTFMDIVESGSSDGVLILGVSRALHQLSKGLPRLDLEAGGAAAERLLAFVWMHLEHYMDSVRHLANQTLAAVVQYCAGLDAAGSGDGSMSLARVLEGVGGLGLSRGLLAACAGAARGAGAGAVLAAVPLARLLPATRMDHLAATAATTLTTLLQSHSQEVESEEILSHWVLPILDFVKTNDLDSEVLVILEKLLAKAVQLDEQLLAYILPHIKEACAAPDSDLRHVMLLGSAVRAAPADRTVGDADNLWRGIIPYDILEQAVVDANDETRVQCLSLLAGGAPVAAADMAVALRYSRHCADAQSPHTRQRAVTHLKKFIKRLADGHRAALRSGDAARADTYQQYLRSLTDTWAADLAPGANYSRRSTALQLLSAAHSAHSVWTAEYVERLLRHLDDSYEANKALALGILLQAPVDMLKDTSVSLQLSDVVRQANALNPTECVSAAYKLELIWRRLGDGVVPGKICTAKEPALYTILSSLRAPLCAELWRGGHNVAAAPRDCPGYGLLYCMAHLIDRLDTDAIDDDYEWRKLFVDIIASCQLLLEATEGVVANVAPEGALPAGCTQYLDNSIDLEDGRIVTAQMVLLCAWRSVKEATAVLGAIGSRVRVPGSLSVLELQEVAESLGRAVVVSRHRGAFEQAYVAYERVLHRMWRDSNEAVRGWAACRLRDTLSWLRAGTLWDRAADRRSAGLPFFVQALVSTEVGAGGACTGLRDVMRSLLAEAVAGARPAARAHACNVLRALYRDSSLDTAVQPYVGEGFQVALKGFEGASWEERNASTLLLSALVQRVFGVSRARAALTARDRMTGRVFFLRYPLLFDVMLDKLKEASAGESKQLLSTSLYPVLLLLARLYPSSLEGTESNIKLVSLVPYVVACARSRVLHTRRLAAAAAVSLVPPDRYVSHLTHLLGLVSEPRVERNFCHGILLQICALLAHKPEGIDCSGLSRAVKATAWILAPARVVCYPVLHQYIFTLAALLTSFPETLDKEMRDSAEAQLTQTLAREHADCASGRPLCLAACLPLLLALLDRREAYVDVTDVLIRSLNHDVAEVCGAALDYLLRLHGRGGDGAEEGKDGTVGIAKDNVTEGVATYKSKAHQSRSEAALARLRARPQYQQSLSRRAREPDIWRLDPQRANKILELLVLEDCFEEVVATAPPPPWHLLASVQPQLSALENLARLVRRGDARLRLYLEALTRCLSQLSWTALAEDAQPLELGLRALLAGCAPGAPRPARAHAARFLRDAAADTLRRAADLPVTQKHAAATACDCVRAALAWLLRDEDAAVRATAALALRPQGARVCVPGLAAARLLESCDLPALVRLALTTPPDEHYTSERIDECRVFEQNEKFNVYSEEDLWLCACADRVVTLARGGDLATCVASSLERINFRVSAERVQLFQNLVNKRSRLSNN